MRTTFGGIPIEIGKSGKQATLLISDRAFQAGNRPVLSGGQATRFRDMTWQRPPEPSALQRLETASHLPRFAESAESNLSTLEANSAIEFNLLMEQ